MDIQKANKVFNLCRLCAEINEELVSIFNKEGREKKLSEKINLSLPIRVSEYDQLPVKICLRCMLWLEMVYTMHNNCKQAEKELRNLFGESSSQDQDVDASVLDNSECSQSAFDNFTTSMSQDTPDSQLDQTMKEENTSPGPPPEYCVSEVQICSNENFESNKHENLSIACFTCCLYFSSSAELQEHYEKTHPNFTTASNKSIKTITKNVALPDKLTTEKIIENKVKGKRGRKAGTSSKTEKKINKRVRNYRYCSYCKMRFLSDDKVNFRLHVKSHNEAIKEEKLKTAQFQCDYCDMRFLTEKTKIYHMRLKHKEYKTFNCEMCGMLFHKNVSLTHHKISKHSNERKFLCDTCGKTFKLKLQLRNHVKVHVTSLIECSICHKQVQPYILNRHMKQHSSGRIYQCSMCPKAFYRKPHLEQHLGVHLKHTYECDICGRIYSRKTNLYPHRKRHEDSVTGKFICLVFDCKKQFPSIGELINHCNEHTRDEILRKVHVTYCEDNMTGAKKSPTTFFCCYCQNYVRHLTIYINHMKKHTKDDLSKNINLQCSICDVNFHSSSTFLDHLTVHPEAYTFGCDFCKQSFVSYKQKMIHVNSVHKDGFQCKVCSETFDSNKSLREHKLSVHIEDRKYQCTFCDKRFSQKRYLTNHTSIHTGEKKFSCDVCSRTFRLKGDLNIHLKIHENDMPFKCSKCNFSCKFRRELVLHLSKVHSESSDSD